MEVLEESLIPPVLLYYQIYRYYGFMQYKLNNRKEALEALLESVTTIEKFVQHSDDVVTSDINSKSQARAFCLLAELEPEKQEEWLDKCFESWDEYEGDKLELQEYADSVVAKAKFEVTKNKEKAE
jgi:hypothetical protein